MRFKIGSSWEGGSSWVILECAAQLAQHLPNGDNLKFEHNYDYPNCQDGGDKDDHDDEEEIDDDQGDSGGDSGYDGQGGVMELFMGRCAPVVCHKMCGCGFFEA